MTLRYALAAAALALLFAGPARAQITITASDYLSFSSSGTPATTTSFSTNTHSDVPADDRAEIKALTEKKGANQTWDFTTLVYPNESTSTVTPFSGSAVAGQPGASNFPTATIVERGVFKDKGSTTTTTVYNYIRANNTAAFSEGTYAPAQNGDPESIIKLEPDALQILAFPLTSGTSWTDQIRTTQTAGGFTVTTTTDYQYTVVGYGTLVTPAGSGAALMLEIKTTSNTVVGGFPGGGPVVFTTYSWVTESRLGAVAAYNQGAAPGGGNELVSASYTAPASTGTPNNAPTVTGTATATATSGNAVDIDVLAGVTDPDNDPLTVTAVTQPAHGTAAIVTGGATRQVGEKVRYTPTAGYTGPDSFQFTVSDGKGGTATGTVNVTVNANSADEDAVAVALRLAVGPNPAHGRTALRVGGAGAAHAAVVVWDALGREVARLHDGPLAAGDHAFALDTGRLAPGVYLARVEADGKAASTRLVVVR